MSVFVQAIFFAAAILGWAGSIALFRRALSKEKSLAGLAGMCAAGAAATLTLLAVEVVGAIFFIGAAVSLAGCAMFLAVKSAASSAEKRTAH